MKKIVSDFGVVALAAVIGFSMASCGGSGSPADNGGNNGPPPPPGFSITITDIPAQHHGYRITINVTDDTGTNLAWTDVSDIGATVTLVPLYDGEPADLPPDTYRVDLQFGDETGFGGDIFRFETHLDTDGPNTLSFNDFEPVVF